MDLEAIRGQLADIESQLLSLNETPSTAITAAGVSDQTGPEPRRHLSMADQYALRAELRQKSAGELSAMFGVQLRKQGVGIPFDAWASAGGSQVGSAFDHAELPDSVRKAIDTGGAAALIRQDLEPILYELFVKQFPAWDRFAKEPANGLVHAYNQVTAFGDAQFMTELGTVTDDSSTYERKTTNVAVIATRRGVSLKSQFAVSAGGMAYNPEQLELQGGLRAIAHKMQKTIFQGQATNSGGTASNELGLYDANSFDGLRSILNQTYVENVDPATSPATTGNMRRAIDEACTPVMDAGGSVSIAYLRATEKTTFDTQQDENVRYTDTRVAIVPGVLTNAVNTIFGPLPLVPVPGDSIGHYTATSTYSGNDVADIYLLDESTISMPFLGSEGPTVLDIPIGISGQLTHLYILFGMWGLAVKAIPWSNKVRVKL
jgi:hypothetical protein